MQGTKNQPWDKKYLEGQKFMRRTKNQPKIMKGTKNQPGDKKIMQGTKNQPTDK